MIQKVVTIPVVPTTHHPVLMALVQMTLLMRNQVLCFKILFMSELIAYTVLYVCHFQTYFLIFRL